MTFKQLTISARLPQARHTELRTDTHRPPAWPSAVVQVPATSLQPRRYGMHTRCSVAGVGIGK